MASAVSGFRRVSIDADGMGMPVESEGCKKITMQNVKMQEEVDSRKRVHSLREHPDKKNDQEQQAPLTRWTRPPFASLPALHMK